MVYQHAENIYSFRIMLPKNPLGWLNCYVIKGLPGERNLLIDTGFKTMQCLNDLKNGMGQLDLEPENTDVFFTHAHFDHIGNAGAMEAVGCRLMISQKDMDFFRSEPWVRSLKESSKDGVPEDVRRAMSDRGNDPEKFKALIVKDGDVLHYGGYELKCILTPGHTPGHVCLYEENKKIMFCGDTVLFDITPNITYIREDMDTLADYLESLDRIEKLPVELALPAHRGMGKKSFYGRIQELKQHHEKRLRETVLAVERFGPVTGYSAAAHLSWSIRAKNWEAFPNGQKWFAMGETLAHLIYLKNKGLIQHYNDEQGLSLYRI